jgi:ribosomal protein S18 acetylase RimI-like enzyme
VGLRVTVRPYDASRDLAELRALNIEHQDFSRSLEPSWPEGVKAVDDYVAYLMKECETRDGCVLLAESDGQTAGFMCAVTTMGPGSPDDPATFAWVHDIYVRPAHRRKGVATALMAAAEAFVRERGARELRLGVIARNEDARAMYRGLGFRDYLRILTKPLASR